MTPLPRLRLTLRARLTLVYGGLFLLSGMLLLGITYALLSNEFRGGDKVVSHSGPDGRALPPNATPPADAVTHETGYTDTVVQRAQDDALTALLTQGAIALALVGTASVAAGWVIAGRVLQPLHRVTDTARRISEAPAADRGLHERIALSGPHDEIRELADTFDVMLARLDHAFDGQRRFIANASHELRTPLSLNKALLEVAARRPDASSDLRQLGTTLLDINARHERLIDGLLLLARSEADLGDPSYVDLADVVDHVVTHTLPALPAAARLKVTAFPYEAPTSGNPVLLERLVQNLVENAVRHNTADDGWVRVSSATRPDGTVEVEVANSGPVVPPYDTPTLFEPFRRLGPDRIATASGAGLGLSIVRAIARAHGGEVHAVPRPEGGLVVTVGLPQAEEDAEADDPTPLPAGTA